MRKALVCAVLALALLWGVQVGTAEVVTYVGGQAIVDGNNTDPFGGGVQMAWGINLSDKLMGWIKYDGFKTEEALDFDNGLIALTYLTPDVLPKLKMGLYVTGEAGATKVENKKSEFGFMGGVGFFFDVTDKMRVWLGGDYKDAAEGNRIYAASLGISLPMSFK
jgi:opacity protein-like surface antigen